MQLKGKRPILMTTATDTFTARAAQAAGMDLISTAENGALGTKPTVIDTVRLWNPNIPVALALPWPNILISEEEALRRASTAIEAGADLVIPSAPPERVAALARQGFACMVRLGLAPQQPRWAGGPDPLINREDNYVRLGQDALTFADAGAVLIELDHVPARIAGEIARRVAIPVISHGSWPSCDGQLLAGGDILGTHHGPCPAHARQYRNLLEEAAAAFREFIDDVNNQAFPAEKNKIRIPDAEFERFMEGLS